MLLLSCSRIDDDAILIAGLNVIFLEEILQNRPLCVLLGNGNMSNPRTGSTFQRRRKRIFVAAQWPDIWNTIQGGGTVGGGIPSVS